MTDVLTPEQRKKNMSAIKGKNTKPEMKIRKMLWAEGVRGYRIHYDLPGKPDIVFPKKKLQFSSMAVTGTSVRNVS